MKTLYCTAKSKGKMMKKVKIGDKGLKYKAKSNG